MYCTRCGTKNAKTSKFCRECGRRLDPNLQPVDAREFEEEAPASRIEDTSKVGELLFQAFQNYEGNKLDEALRLCQEALRLHPDSTSGHSLLAMVFEAKGDLTAALRHYDRVVMVNPGSVADREKRDDLRRRLRAAAEPSLAQQLRDSYLDPTLKFLVSKRPWPEAIGAFLVTFLALALLWPQSEATPPTAGQPAPLAAGQTYGGQEGQVAQGVQPQAPPPSSGGDLPFIGGSSGPSTGAADSGYVPSAGNAPAQTVARSAASRTPSRLFPPDARVYIPPVTIGIRPRTRPATALPSITPAPTPRPAPSNGTISITRSPGGNGPQGSVQTARELQMSGQYEDAIAAWRRALGGSQSQGEVYQHIGTCYQRLGRHGEAISNYQSAIKAYDQQISVGRDVDQAQRGRKSSELAMRVSQQAGG